MLDHAGDADAMCAQNLRQRGQHAGLVGNREPQIVPARDLVGRRASGRDAADRPHRLSTREVMRARPVTTSIRSPITAEAVGIIPAPRP